MKKPRETFCKETNVGLDFSTTKISSFFSAKDKIPSTLKFFVVYKFLCANCMASCVGQTCRHLDERIYEHFKYNSSHIFQHLNENEACKVACDQTCFHEIADHRFFCLVKNQRGHAQGNLLIDLLILQ